MFQESVPAFADFTAEDAAGGPPKKAAPKKEKPAAPKNEEAPKPATPPPKQDAPAPRKPSGGLAQAGSGTCAGAVGCQQWLSTHDHLRR